MCLCVRGPSCLRICNREMSRCDKCAASQATAAPFHVLRKKRAGSRRPSGGRREDIRGRGGQGRDLRIPWSLSLSYSNGQARTGEAAKMEEEHSRTRAEKRKVEGGLSASNKKSKSDGFWSTAFYDGPMCCCWLQGRCHFDDRCVHRHEIDLDAGCQFGSKCTVTRSKVASSKVYNHIKGNFLSFNTDSKVHV